jgi:hypothetical protein
MQCHLYRPHLLTAPSPLQPRCSLVVGLKAVFVPALATPLTPLPVCLQGGVISMLPFRERFFPNSVAAPGSANQYCL